MQMRSYIAIYTHSDFYIPILFNNPKKMFFFLVSSEISTACASGQRQYRFSSADRGFHSTPHRQMRTGRWGIMKTVIPLSKLLSNFSRTFTFGHKCTSHEKWQMEKIFMEILILTVNIIQKGTGSRTLVNSIWPVGVIVTAFSQSSWPWDKVVTIVHEVKLHWPKKLSINIL